MRKRDLILALSSMYEVKNCVVRRVYGVSSGVGYDMDVLVQNNNTGELHLIQAHANNRGWFYPSHLRPNNPPYQYTGSCDRYRERVISAWMDNPNALEYYFANFKKEALQFFYEIGLL